MVPSPQSLLHTSYWLRKTKVTHTRALLAKSLHPPTQSRPLKTAPSSQHVQQPTSKIGSCCKLRTERLLSAREPPTCQPCPASNFQLPPADVRLPLCLEERKVYAPPSPLKFPLLIGSKKLTRMRFKVRHDWSSVPCFFSLCLVLGSAFPSRPPPPDPPLPFIIKPSNRRNAS